VLQAKGWTPVVQQHGPGFVDYHEPIEPLTGQFHAGPKITELRHELRMKPEAFATEYSAFTLRIARRISARVAWVGSCGTLGTDTSGGRAFFGDEFLAFVMAQ
jgi:hypothetical protein